MARVTKDTLTAQVAALTAQVAALEAKVTLARECWRNQKATIADLEAKLAARGRFVDAPAPTPARAPAPTPTVTPARLEYLRSRAAKDAAWEPMYQRAVASVPVILAAAIARGEARATADLVARAMADETV